MPVVKPDAHLADTFTGVSDKQGCLDKFAPTKCNHFHPLNAKCTGVIILIMKFVHTKD